MLNSIQGFSSMQGMEMMGMRPRPQALTDDQKSQVQSILSQYDASNITEADAKGIFQAFKDAGIQPGPGMRETIEAAGFDAEDLRTKAGIGGPQGGPPPGGMSGMSRQDSLSMLKSMQSILGQYDLTSLSSDQEDELFSKLSEAGLMRSGSLFNIGV